MGTRNAQLIRSCENARRSFEFLKKCVEDSQAECPHPPDRVKEVSPFHQTRGTAPRFCLDCSKSLP
jgi:hypothetical protein